MGVVSAIVAGAVIVGGATYMASQQQSKATEKAARLSKEGGDIAVALQREMYEKGLELGQPFYDVGLGALPELQSAIMGKPIQNIDPRYRLLDKSELPTRGTPRPGGLRGAMEALSGRSPTANKQWYMGPDGKITDSPPMLTTDYSHKESPVAKYALQTGGRELMRGLGARGLAGSGLAPYKLGELTSQIYASDYDKQIARLSGLVDIGTGQSSNLSQLGQQYGTSAGNIYIGAGENQANAALAAGRGQASLYQGMGQMATNLASLYMMGGGSFGGQGGIPNLGNIPRG